MNEKANDKFIPSEMVIKGFVESNTYQNEILQKVKISPGKIVPCLRVVSKNNKINEFNELSD